MPFLGVCLGMQVAVIEFARHVVRHGRRQLDRVRPARRRTRSSTCCPSRRSSSTRAARCASAPSPCSCGAGTQARAAYGADADPRAPPAPLRGQQRTAPAARGGRARDLRRVRRRRPGRGDRAAGPPVLRREPVPPGVQVASDAAVAAVPRLRRRARSSGSGPVPAAAPATRAADDDGAKAAPEALAVLPGARAARRRPPARERADGRPLRRATCATSGSRSSRTTPPARLDGDTGNLYARIAATAEAARRSSSARTPTPCRRRRRSSRASTATTS